jgi:hypothetical protein
MDNLKENAYRRNSLEFCAWGSMTHIFNTKTNIFVFVGPPKGINRNCTTVSYFLCYQTRSITSNFQFISDPVKFTLLGLYSGAHDN